LAREKKRTTNGLRGGAPGGGSKQKIQSKTSKREPPSYIRRTGAGGLEGKHRSGRKESTFGNVNGQEDHKNLPK